MKVLAGYGSPQNIVATNPNALRRSRPGSGQIFHESRGERAVLSVAVGGRRTRLRGEGDQRVRAAGSTLANPRPIAREPIVRFMVLLERIVATGIQNNKPKLPRRLDDGQKAIERDGFVERVDIAFEDGIDRNDIVVAVDLHAMSGEIDDCDIGIADPVGEIAQGAPHFTALRSSLRWTMSKPGIPERRCHRAGIVGGIGQGVTL